MDIKIDNRTLLVNLIEHMSDTDTQQMLAYAVGYEAGKISQVSAHINNNPPQQTA